MKIIALIFYCTYIHFRCVLSLQKESQIAIQGDSVLNSLGEENYPENEEISSSKICSNIKEIYKTFGANSTDLYSSCDYSYWLLGRDNQIILSSLPLCYLNIADVFCKYEIVFLNETISDDLREKILRSLNGCSKQSLDFKCPGFNFEKKNIDDENEFCNKCEIKDVLYNNDNYDSNEDSTVYTFIKKEVYNYFLRPSYNFILKKYLYFIGKSTL